MKELGKKILWLRARDYIRRHRPTLIGITGSTGKTMTKNAIALCLHDNSNIRVSPLSYNTPIGVALAILGVKRQTTKAGWVRLLTGSRLRELAANEPDTMILELGADRPGDIDFFARQLPFTVGVVTNVKSTHLELFINRELVAHEKMSLITSLPATGYAILNADDPLVYAMAEHTKATAIYFGESDKADVRLRRVHRLNDFSLACEILARGKIYELHLPHIIARHQLPNMLASLAVVIALKGDTKQAIQRLSKLTPPPSRMRLLAGINNSLILDDTYNASPESTQLALDTLLELPTSNRRLAILGDMLDLGAQSVSWHKKIGQHAAQAADILITVGDNMRSAGAAALKQDNTTDVHHFDTSGDVGKWLTNFLEPGDLTLVKGSRLMRMERVTKDLLANPEQDADQVVSS